MDRRRDARCRRHRPQYLAHHDLTALQRQVLGVNQAEVCGLRPNAVLIIVMRGVQLVHAVVQQGEHATRAGLAQVLKAGLLGHSQQHVHRQQLAAGAKGQALRHGTGGAQAGKGARPLTKDDGAINASIAGIKVLEASAPPAPLCCQSWATPSSGRVTAMEMRSVLVSKASSFMENLVQNKAVGHVSYA